MPIASESGNDTDRNLGNGRPPSSDRFDFLDTGSWPFDPKMPSVIPIKPAPTAPTIPKTLEPFGGLDVEGQQWKNKGFSPEFLEELDRRERQRKWADKLRKAQALNVKAGMKAVDLYKKSSPWSAGFQLGWEIGDYFLPKGHPFYDVFFKEDQAGAPDTSVYPEGWHYIGPGTFASSRCVADGYNCPGTGRYWVPAQIQIGLGNTCLCDFAGNNWTELQAATSYPDPPSLYAAVPSTATAICWSRSTANPARVNKVGDIVPNATQANKANPLNWVQETLPGTKIIVQTATMADVFNSSPVVNTHPVPEAWPDAVPEPKTQGEGKHLPAPSVVITPMPLPPTPVADAVGSPPGAQPPTQVVTIYPPGGPPPTIVVRPPDPRRPPRPGTKEKKLSVRTKANVAWVVLNIATEVFDFIDAMFQGLPEHIRKEIHASIDRGAPGGGNADPYAKAMAIYEFFDLIDWEAATLAFVNNQIEDMVFGMLGMAGNTANTLSGAATGGGGAVLQRPAKITEKAHDDQLADMVQAGVITKEEADFLDESNDIPIPKMYIDENGNWQLEIPPLFPTIGGT